MKTLKEAIEDQLEERRLSVPQLARLARVDVQTMKSILENGGATLREKTYRRICTRLGLDFPPRLMPEPEDLGPLIHKKCGGEIVYVSTEPGISKIHRCTRCGMAGIMV